MDDRIEIRGLRVKGYHGVYESERRDGQPFVIDADLEVDLRAASASDRLEDTIDYGGLADRLAAAVRDTRFDLIEALAGHLADLALENSRVDAARIRVAKPEAPVEASLAEVAVTVHRARPEETQRYETGMRSRHALRTGNPGQTPPTRSAGTPPAGAESAPAPERSEESSGQPTDGSAQ